MAFKKDALSYIAEEAIPSWEDREERRDSYIPRMLVPEEASSKKNDIFGHLTPTLRDNELVDVRKGAVLGRAGAGKSYVLAKSYRGALGRFVEHEGEAPFPMYLDCGSHSLPSSNRIDEALQAGAGGELFGRVAQEHPPGAHLFIDEADVRVRQTTTSFPADLQGALQRIAAEIEPLHLTITSRKKEWEQLSVVQSAVGQVKIYAFPSRPLGDEYSYLIPERDERNRFFDLCRAKGYHDLLALAFEGFGMAREFTETGELPKTREKLWDRQISARLVKSDADVGLAQAPSRSRLRYLARLLACLSAFSGREPWSFREAVDDLGSAPTVGHIQPVTPEEVKWLLGSRLFEQAEETGYGFIHERYRDRLCAEILSTLKPRKKRLLLMAGSVEGRNRTAPSLRTVAATLASIDPSFRSGLIDQEPEIAIFGSLPGMQADRRQELVSAVVEWGVKNQVVPWYEIEGIGERVDSALARHRLNNPRGFLEDSLGSDSPMRRLWAVTLANEWNGVAGLLNSALSKIAADDDEKVATRKRAIEAIQRSGDGSYRQLFSDLTHHESDEVRGHALEAWRELTNPSPSEYAAALTEERRNTSFYGKLSREPNRFALALDAEGIEESFHALDEQSGIKGEPSDPPLSSLNSLQEAFLRALLKRAIEVEDASLPVSFIVDYFVRPSMQVHARDELRNLLQNRPNLWRQVFGEALSRADELAPSPAQLTNILGETIPGDPDEELPQNDELSPSQQQFAGPVRAQAEQRRDAETEDSKRGATFEDLIGDGVSIPPSVDEDAVRERLRHMLNSWDGEEADRVKKLVEEVWRVQAQVDSDHPVNPHRLETLAPEKIQAVLALVRTETRKQIVEALETEFPDLAEHPAGRPVACLLMKQGTDLPLESVERLLRRSQYWADSRSKLEADLLARLRKRDRSQWQEVALDLIEANPGASKHILQQLIDTQDDLYLDRAKLRLRGADFERRGEWIRLLEYVLQHEPEDLPAVLLTALHTARAKRHVAEVAPSVAAPPTGGLHLWDIAQVLFELVRRSEQGWRVFDELIDAEEMPLTARQKHGQIQIPEPESEFQISVLSRWYHQIREARDRLGDDSPYSDGSDYDVLAAEVMSRIVRCGTQDALQAVKALQQEGAFEGAKRLSGRVLEAEDELLKSQCEARPPRQLLELVTTDFFHLIQSEEDLFEVVRQAVEDLQEDFRRARGVAGFWKPVPQRSDSYVKEDEDPPTFASQPKHEEECQNMLWALIRPRLHAYGVADVEEEVVGANYADLRVEYSTSGRSSPKVFIEVKVARKDYARAELINPLKTQLFEEHLHPTGTTHGIYVVIWARDKSRHDYPRGYESPSDLLEELKRKAESVREKRGKVIAPYILDISEPYRQSGR